MCTENVRNALIYEKGIKRVTTNLKTKEIYVKYNPKKIDTDKIEKLIAEAGYNANSTKRIHESYHSLPKCCKEDGHCED